MTHLLLGRKATQLLQACYDNPCYIGYHEVREFLSGPYKAVLHQNLSSWGGLVERLLDHALKEGAVDTVDMQCVVSYLHGVNAWLQEQAAQSSEVPPNIAFEWGYSSFSKVCRHLAMDGQGHPGSLLWTMRTQGIWQPQTLVATLQTVSLDSTGNVDNRPPMQCLLRMAMALLVHTDWQPSAPEVLAGLWALHHPNTAPGTWNFHEFFEAHGRTTRIFLTKMPSTLPQGLVALTSLPSASWLDCPELLEPFFPLPFERCAPLAFINALGGLMASCNAQARMVLNNLLVQHHPALCDLMQMHLALHSGPCTDYSHLVMGLRKILGETCGDDSVFFATEVGHLFEEA